jgi:ribosomal protein S6
MNKYEAMIIYPESMKDESIDAAFEKIAGEIEKLGGTVENKTRIGRRAFARPLKKHAAGQYAVIGFFLDGQKVAPLQARFKLNEDIFRVQVVRAAEAPVEAA